MSWPALASPRVRIAGVFPLADRGFGHVYRGETHAIHLHDYHGSVRIDDHEIPLVPGTMTLSPAGRGSTYSLSRPGTHWCVHFEPGDGGAGGPQITLPLARDLSRWNAEAATRFTRVARLHAMAGRADLGGELEAATSVVLQELLVWYAMIDVLEVAPSGATHSKAVEDLTAYIGHNLHRPLSVPQLAAAAGLSQNYLARLFRAQTGMTIPRYVNTRRVTLAKLLLRTTDLPVKRIGVRIGCPDPQHLNKLFRSVAGVSPSEYRAGKDRGALPMA